MKMEGGLDTSIITLEELESTGALLGLSRAANELERGNWLSVIHDGNMTKLVEWAKAYEAGAEVVTDVVYDYTVSELVGFKSRYPEHWEVLLEKHPLFRDGRWQMTGNFWR